MSRMPVVFFGHGSPMIALETNDTTRTWRAMGVAIGKPRGILCVSAHWLTQGVSVTAMAAPRTIHDFGASFPKALFEMQYPAPGSPELAARVRDLLAPQPVLLDRQAWGLDHGSWSVLSKVYPDADVPVVQLSMDATRQPEWHFELARRLAPLRDEGVLIVGTGNIVHNLPAMNWGERLCPPYDWSQRFNDHIKQAIVDDAPERAVNFASQGADAARSVPTPDHYWPLLYVLGARLPGDVASFAPDHIEHGSLSMTSVTLAAPAA
ncbi:MAG TPA: 4,5-DOPA dioxygenase extradiol [Caulobacter sp.]|nr:4,5-DOPA dioxygenase extradiol [Caulobacter sp.]